MSDRSNPDLRDNRHGGLNRSDGEEKEKDERLRFG